MSTRLVADGLPHVEVNSAAIIRASGGTGSQYGLLIALYRERRDSFRNRAN